jgi:hypothetical protein
MGLSDNLGTSFPLATDSFCTVQLGGAFWASVIWVVGWKLSFVWEDRVELGGNLGLEG